MKNNWYPIVGVSANTSGTLNPNKGGHWVVVTGLSEEKLWNLGTEFQWVRIYNPASNRLEYFPWNYFLSTWGTASDLSGKPSYINRIIISIHSPFVSPVKGLSRLE